MHLDIFNDDAFSVSQLTLAMNETVPHQPGRIGELGLFSEEGISTLNVTIESIGTTLSLVQSAARGSPGKPVVNDKRKMRSFNVVHLPQRGAVLADEVQNLRAFGSESDVETVQNLVNRKLAKMKRNIDATTEWQRMGAIKGQVLDADASVLLDLFTDFGVVQQTKDMGLDSSGTKVKQMSIELQRLIEAELGGIMHSGIRVLCSPGFFDDFTGHDAVVAAYDRWMDGQFKRETQRKGFWFADIWWEEYRGKVGATDFIADGEAYAIPEGVADQFVSYYGPADYLETVNTNGLPYYAKQWNMEGDKGKVLEAQSNPLHLNTRPRAVVKLTAA
jgi:hypothetical protein